jgi:AcrR family transcriptional regulator
MSRPYDNSRRAAAAATTTELIAVVTEALLAEGPVAEITLQTIAERAGVTVQTVLRHMGSRDGCFAAVRERFVARIDAHRAHTAPGDVGAALAGLLAHYEADGRLVLNLLSQESNNELARDAVADGRAYHRAWVERCFGPCLGDGASSLTIDALVVATDLSTWKLLRLDLGRSAEDTSAVLRTLVAAILEHP